MSKCETNGIAQATLSTSQSLASAPRTPFSWDASDAAMAKMPTFGFELPAGLDAGLGQQNAAAPDMCTPWTAMLSPHANSVEAHAAPVNASLVEASCVALFDTLVSFHPSADIVFKVLRGRSPAELRAIKEKYKYLYNEDLTKRVDRAFGDPDLAEAMALLDDESNPSYAKIRAAAAGIDNALHSLVTDKTKIKSILASLDKNNELPQLLKYTISGTGKTVEEALNIAVGSWWWSKYDRDEVKALMEGDQAKAKAVQLDNAISGIGTKEEVVYSTLGNIKDPAERAAVEQAYAARHNNEETLEQAIAGDFEGPERTRAIALLQGDAAAAAAAQLRFAIYGFGSDNAELSDSDEPGQINYEPGIADLDELFKILESYPDSSSRNAIINKYNSEADRLGIQTGIKPRHLRNVLEEKLDGLDREKAIMLCDFGKLTDQFALRYAMKGQIIGTDEDLIKNTLKNKTKSEINEIKSNYGLIYSNGSDPEARKGALDKDLKSELDGADLFEVEDEMRGIPESDAERGERSQNRYNFYRSGISKRIMDWISPESGQAMDRAYMRTMQSSMNPNVSSSDHYNDFGLTVENYKHAKDLLASNTATGVFVGAGIVLTLVTLGGSAPWFLNALSAMGIAQTNNAAILAALTTLSSGGAGMLTKVLIKGAEYGGEEKLIDATRTVLFALVSAGVQLPGPVDGLNKAFGVATGVDKTPLQSFLVNGTQGAISGALFGTIQASFNERSAQRQHTLANVTQWVGLGTIFGGLSGGLSNAFLTKMGPGVSDPYMWEVLRNSMASTLSTALSGVANPAAYAQDQQAQLKFWIERLLYFGFLSGVFGGIAAGKLALNKVNASPWPGDTPAAEENAAISANPPLAPAPSVASGAGNLVAPQTPHETAP